MITEGARKKQIVTAVIMMMALFLSVGNEGYAADEFDAYRKFMENGIMLTCSWGGEHDYRADQFAVFDFNQDGVQELLAFGRQDSGDTYHWKLFTYQDGNVILLAEDSGIEDGNAGHVIAILGDTCLYESINRSLVGYDAVAETYTYWEDGEVNRLFHRDMVNHNWNEQTNTYDDVEEELYKLNDEELSIETGKQLEQKFEGKEVISIGDVENIYSFYGQENNDNTAGDASYILPYSSDRYLVNEDIENLSLQELNYARNEIYARYGRDFKSQELKDYFGSKAWYQMRYSPESFPYDRLSEIEKYNVDFLYGREHEIQADGYQLY